MTGSNPVQSCQGPHFLIFWKLRGWILKYKCCYRHSQLVRTLPCTSQFALGTNPTVLQNCQPFDVQTKGSALNLYNSTSYYDDLLWAAAWMYKATGDQNYLKDAEDFYIRHLYNEGGSDTLLYNWDDYFWAANVLLVNVCSFLLHFILCLGRLHPFNLLCL
jgi:Glycosyl hydrolase family 9